MPEPNTESTSPLPVLPANPPAATAGQSEDVDRPRALPTTTEPVPDVSSIRRPTRRPPARAATNDGLTRLEREAPRRAPGLDDLPAAPPAAPAPTPAEALGLVADASAALAASLPLDEMLAAIGRLLVPRFGDLCVLDLESGMADDEGPRRLVMATAFDEPTEQIVRDYVRRFPAPPTDRIDPVGARRLAAGQPLLLHDLGERDYGEIASTPEQRELLLRFHPRDVLAVPLRAQGRAVGVMSVVNTRAHVPSEGEVAVVTELGQRVAQAVLAARLAAVARRNELRLAAALEARDTFARAVEESAAERDRLAEQARHAQRIESLGVLAGGVAHDFNNLLTVILSTLDLVRTDLPAGDRVQTDLEEMRGAAVRASQLTRQLLAFSRRQVMQPRPLDLNAVVSEAERLLRRLVGERVAFAVSLEARALPLCADPVQLEQVLVNLVMNARDAVLQRSGVGANPSAIMVETGTTLLDDEASARVGLPVGRYACLAVRDTGVGMDEATRRNVFEPFFTTKPLGQGTGLGLAMVHDIVTQSGGTVRVESQPGQGSTFHVLLPMTDDATAHSASQAAPAPPGGQETVLLVEDEAGVRGVARRILQRAGYKVFEARHGADALLVWQEQGGAAGSIDALLTDLRMPELGGRELAALLRHERPDLPVVYLSGYAEPQAAAVTSSPEAAAQLEVAAAGPSEQFVTKPFVAPELQRALREVLDVPRRPRPVA